MKIIIFIVIYLEFQRKVLFGMSQVIQLLKTNASGESAIFIDVCETIEQLETLNEELHDKEKYMEISK